MSRELNLVPQIKSNSKGGTKSSTTIILLLLIVVLFVGGSFGYTFAREYLLNKKVKDLKSELSLSNKKLKEKETLDEQIAATKQQIAKATQLKELTNIDTDGTLAELFKLVQVNGIKITEIKYTPGVKPLVEVKGTTPSPDILASMWTGVRSNEKFVESYMPSWEVTSENEIKYSFKVDLKEGSLNEKQN